MSASQSIAMALALAAQAPAEWSAGPMAVETNRNVRPPEQLMIEGDLVLAPGFSASVVANPEKKPLVLERTFDASIRPRGHDALVLIAQGNIGPARISFGTLDYDLVLDPSWRRYEIPLDDLRPREGAISSKRSFAIASALPSVQSSSITVGFVGFGELGPRIRRVTTPAGGARVFLSGPPRHDRQLNVATEAAVSTIDVTSNTIDVGDPISGKLWLCHRHEVAVVCDPPDAPHTYYLRPPRRGESLLIHDFDTAAQVTAQREPVKRFASSRALDMTFVQSEGTLKIGMPIAQPSDHGGIELPLPALPAHLKTLELRLRGDIAADAVSISLGDPSGKITRLELAAYVSELGPDWRTLSLPLAAPRPHRLAVTLSGRARAGTLEIDLIRLGPRETMPAKVARASSP